MEMHGKWSWCSWEPHGRRGGLLWEVGAYTNSETLVGMRKVEQAIKMPYSDLLASHQRERRCACAACQNREVHHLDTWG
jgi:hypothetical protein